MFYRELVAGHVLSWSRRARINNIYTDAYQFFHDGSALTDGIKFVLLEVLSRLSADNSAPAMYRLEMTFGGGKPHRLTALPHLVFRASEFTGAAEPLIDGAPLPAPGEC